MTHHSGDHPHAEIPQLTPEIAVNPHHTPHISHKGTPHLNPHLVLAGQQ